MNDSLCLADAVRHRLDEFVTQAFAKAGEEASASQIALSEWITREQRRVHGLAWLRSLVEGLTSTIAWAQESAARGDGPLREIDQATLALIAAETCAQVLLACPLSQSELLRPHDIAMADEARALLTDDAVSAALDGPRLAETRAALVDRLRAGERPSEALGDDALDMVRDQFRAFTANRITPHAHDWHLADALIPDRTVAQMAELGVFGVCIAEEHGGLGLGKLAMSVVSEELSRGWICAGSLGTRSEIAGELIAANGTDAQKRHWLPRIADGSVLPTAVFTEPDTGSDLAAVATRAVRTDTGWRIDGAKTWITHAARADLMTVLARSDPEAEGYRGLSMMLAAKQRGSEETPFPDQGLDGSEIEVLGYRGMKEYALGFDGFAVAEDGLLGGAEGQGFKQLMATFEGARIQTAARAVGVAWNAFDLALAYAEERKQFGTPIAAFPRVADKLAQMVADIVMARELTYSAARAKDTGQRCDVEAGMAKLIAARAAWAAADSAVQIHGGNGYALEYPISRVLCDARILNIFEGAGEIQAQVIGRNLLAAAIQSKG